MRASEIAYGTISNNGGPLQWLIFCVMISIVLKSSFVCKHTKCAFRNKRNEKLLAIATDAWGLKATKLGEGWDFSRGLSQKSDEMLII